jgi:hypothetical protein
MPAPPPLGPAPRPAVPPPPGPALPAHEEVAAAALCGAQSRLGASTAQSPRPGRPEVRGALLGDPEVGVACGDREALPDDEGHGVKGREQWGARRSPRGRARGGAGGDTQGSARPRGSAARVPTLPLYPVPDARSPRPGVAPLLGAQGPTPSHFPSLRAFRVVAAGN